MAKTESPTPNETVTAREVVPFDELPKCVCGQKLDLIRFVDYEDVRVVVHTGPNCVVGVINLAE